MAKSREVSSTCSVVIYTVVGVRDSNLANELPQINVDENESDLKTCYIAFVGKNSFVTRDRKGWLVVELDKFDKSEQSSVRYLPKYNPHGFFADSVKYAIFAVELKLLTL